MAVFWPVMVTTEGVALMLLAVVLSYMGTVIVDRLDVVPCGEVELPSVAVEMVPVIGELVDEPDAEEVVESME